MKNTTRLVLTFLSLIAAITLPAAEEKKEKAETFLDPEKAGPDYSQQGEYVGAHLGAQVIALANDKFRLVLLQGGLPGAGWDESPKIEIEGKRDGDSIGFTGKDGYTATLTGHSLKGSTASGDERSSI